MSFDKQKHAKALLDVEGIVISCEMLAEGLSPANNQMGESQFANAASGAFSLMAEALYNAMNLISEADRDFRLHHGLGWGSAPAATETAAEAKPEKEVPEKATLLMEEYMNAVKELRSDIEQRFPYPSLRAAIRALEEAIAKREGYYWELREGFDEQTRRNSGN